MEDAVSRRSLVEIVIIALAVACLAAPSLAMADVLEISDGRANWIAGGPQSEPALVAQAGTATGAVGPSASTPITLAPVTAGPERWQAKVAQLAAKYDISPSLLEALVWQESRWRQQAYSPAGAQGLAQLMPGTARQMGVDPADPDANLEGGARYLRMQLDTFGGNVEKALAAYNAGPGRVMRAGGIPNIRETQDYVARIMARLSAPVRR